MKYALYNVTNLNNRLSNTLILEISLRKSRIQEPKENFENTISKKIYQEIHIRKPYQKTISEKQRPYQETISGNHIRKWILDISWYGVISENRLFSNRLLFSHIKKSDRIWTFFKSIVFFSYQEKWPNLDFFQIDCFFFISRKVTESGLFSNRLLFSHIRKSDRIWTFFKSLHIRKSDIFAFPDMRKKVTELQPRQAPTEQDQTNPFDQQSRWTENRSSSDVILLGWKLKNGRKLPWLWKEQENWLESGSW